MVEADTQPVVEARGLLKDFGQTRAVDNVSFQITRGEVVGFLGPNGAGKTTTMQMLTGFLKPTAGSALVGDRDVSEDPIRAQRMLGYLPEGAPLYDEMMVIDFLSYVAVLRQVPADQRTRRLRSIAERCGLMDVLGKDIGQLSKGYRQRVALAQAMVHDPDLLVLDEPTSGLDPNQIIEIRELIKDLGREKTVILSTHILPEVQATCNRIIILRDGKIVADDTPEALSEQEAGAVIRLVLKPRNGSELDAGAVRALLEKLPGVRAVEPDSGEGERTLGLILKGRGSQDPRESVFEAAASHDWVILEMHEERVSLEDTFRRLTRREGED